MIVGVGCDIIEIERIARAIKRESFIRRVFTAEEAGYCQRRGQQAAASFAARFAAKEAVLKALSSCQKHSKSTRCKDSSRRCLYSMKNVFHRT